MVNDGTQQWEKISQNELDEVIGSHELFAAGRMGGTRAMLKFHDMSYLDLRNRDLRGADFTGALLCHAEMEAALLSEANLFGADLRAAKLAWADLSKTDLRAACLAGADLNRANLEEADMREGQLLTARGVGGDISNVTQDIAATGMEQATARGANMSGARVSNSFIVQTDMTDCNLRNAKFIRANLSLSNMTGCNLEGADFSEANLSGAIFHGASFNGTLLDHADLSGADLIGAVFDNMDFSKVNLGDAKVAQSIDKLDKSIKQIIRDHVEWVATNGKKGDRADLSKTDLSRMDLSSVNLSAADLSYAVMPAVNLSRSEMIMADMSYADLRGANLDRAVLRGIKLARATLDGASLVGVDLGPSSIDQSGFTAADGQRARAEITNSLPVPQNDRVIVRAGKDVAHEHAGQHFGRGLGQIARERRRRGRAALREHNAMHRHSVVNTGLNDIKHLIDKSQR